MNDIPRQKLQYIISQFGRVVCDEPKRCEALLRDLCPENRREINLLICDNDNVTVDGGAEGGILGTPRFMAPEVVRGQASPGTRTDLFSLSVLLFYMLMVHHPLEGKRESEIKCFDLPAMNRLYGTEPVFIFDPYDDTNRPVLGCHDNALLYWQIYPQSLRDIFIKAFTDGTGILNMAGCGRVNGGLK